MEHFSKSCNEAKKCRHQSTFVNSRVPLAYTECQHLIRSSHCEGPLSAVSASSGTLLEMQILGPHSHTHRYRSRNPGCGAQQSVFGQDFQRIQMPTQA